MRKEVRKQHLQRLFQDAEMASKGQKATFSATADEV